MKKQILALVMIFGVMSFAENSVLTVPDLLNLADQNSIQLQVAQSKVNLANAQYVEAFTAILPKFSANGGYTKMDSYATRLQMQEFALMLNNPAIANMSSEAEYWSAYGKVTQLLFNGNVLPAIQGGTYGLQAAQQGLASTREDVYFSIVKMYLATIQIDKQLEVQKESKDQLEKILARVIEMKNNGLATQIDVLRTQASVSGIKVAITNLLSAKDIMLSNLEMLVAGSFQGKSLDSQIVDRLYSDSVYNPSMSVDAVLPNRPDYSQLQATKLLMNSVIDLQAGSWLPTLVAYAQYGYEGTDGFRFDSSNRDWMYGINGSWSVFDFGTTGAKIDQAKANASMVDQQIEATRRGVVNDLKTIALNIKAARANIDALKEEEQLDVDTFNLINSRYHLGELTNLELIDAQNQLLNVRGRLVGAKIDYAQNVVLWLKATGQLSTYFKKGVSS